MGAKTPAEGSDRAKIAAAIMEARGTLKRLTATGAHVIFDAPKPMMPSPVYRCADWYSRINPVCAGGIDISRDEMRHERRPMLMRMMYLAAENPLVGIWDSFDILCPET